MFNKMPLVIKSKIKKETITGSDFKKIITIIQIILIN